MQQRRALLAENEFAGARELVEDTRLFLFYGQATLRRIAHDAA
jgi:hypothetical protein